MLEFKEFKVARRGRFWLTSGLIILVVAICLGLAWFRKQRLQGGWVDCDTDFMYRTPYHSRPHLPFDLTSIPQMEKPPSSLGVWTSREKKPTPAVVEPDLIWERGYGNRSEAIWLQLVIAYKTERQLHVPTICYWNSNWEIEEKAVEGVNIGPETITVGKIVAHQRNDPNNRVVELYIYFWKDRPTGINAGCTQIRASISVKGDVDAATAHLKDFLVLFLKGEWLR